MSTRRKFGNSAATTEAARRQLMAKVPCWEKAWVIPEGTAPGPTFKVYKWVKTDRTQQFSDDEDEENEPLAPIPDEPEAAEGEGDEDLDQDDLALPGSLQEAASVASFEPSEATGLPKESEADDVYKQPSPKPHPLSISFQPNTESEQGDVLDDSLAVGVGVVNMGVDGNNPPEVDVGTLDMSALGPDGTAFEGAHNLSQMNGGDALMEELLMDGSVDPFANGLVESADLT